MRRGKLDIKSAAYVDKEKKLENTPWCAPQERGAQSASDVKSEEFMGVCKLLALDLSWTISSSQEAHKSRRRRSSNKKVSYLLGKIPSFLSCYFVRDKYYLAQWSTWMAPAFASTKPFKLLCYCHWQHHPSTGIEPATLAFSTGYNLNLNSLQIQLYPAGKIARTYDSIHIRWFCLMPY